MPRPVQPCAAQVGALVPCDYPTCCRAAYGMGTNASNSAGLFGEFNCDLAPATLKAWVAALQAIIPSA